MKNYQSLRFTRDADALAVAISKEKLGDLVCAALTVDLNDGLWFGDIHQKELTEQGEYDTCRFDCAFQIGSPDLKKLHKFSRVHIDIGFSDKLPTKPENQIMPSVLEYEEPVSWKIYPIEYIIAEKVQTLFDRGSQNSRTKDIYDIVYLFPRSQDHNALMAAIRNTFENRGTPLPKSFLEQASQFDQTILSHGWPGVKILAQKPDFETVWSTLMKALKQLDKEMGNESNSLKGTSKFAPLINKVF